MDQSTPRINGFDHVRGLAVIFMIICHVSLTYGTREFLSKPYGWFADNGFGTGPAAPVFMLAMGFFLAYSNDKPIPSKVIRGIKLFSLGILLNISRSIIPYLITQQIEPGSPGGYASYLGVEDGWPVLWRMLYELDILPFAGIALILMASLQLFISKIWQWIVIATIVLFASPYLWGLGEGLGAFYHAILQPLWGSAYIPEAKGDNPFPVFPWLIYPIAGYVLGMLMRAGVSHHGLMLRMASWGGGLCLASLPWFFYNGTDQFGDYYRMFPGGSLITLGFALSWPAFFLWVEEKGIAQQSLQHLNFWSQNVTLIYCVHWVLLGFGVIGLGFQQIDSLPTILTLTVFCLVTSYWITRWLSASKSFMRYFGWFTH